MQEVALAQGSALSADIVVLMSLRFNETVSSSIPITTPTSQTTYTNGNASVYGTGGTANVYGNSTSTTYGSRTTYIPVTTHRYDFMADDTPAFEADILVGDIVLSTNDRSDSSVESFQGMLQNIAGQRLKLEIIRNGELITRIVQIP